MITESGLGHGWPRKSISKTWSALFFYSCILHDLRKSLPWQLPERSRSSEDLRGWRRAGFISLLPSLTFPLSLPISPTTPAIICSPLSSDISKHTWVRNSEKGGFSSVGRVIAYYAWVCRFGPQHLIKLTWWWIPAVLAVRNRAGNIRH